MAGAGDDQLCGLADRSTMIEQSNHYRVSQLVQALTFWIARDLGA